MSRMVKTDYKEIDDNLGEDPERTVSLEEFLSHLRDQVEMRTIGGDKLRIIPVDMSFGRTRLDQAAAIVFAPYGTKMPYSCYPNLMIHREITDDGESRVHVKLREGIQPALQVWSARAASQLIRSRINSLCLSN